MSWKKVKLGDFLKVRDNRFKPNDKAIGGLKRIDKIDFSGEIYISDKPSNTDMILIKKGDLIISGINVEKGAMAVYTGDEDITATIHYSSYSFNENDIDIDFLKYFLRSIEFRNALKEQVPGGIKTEIKPKHLLPLKVIIPTDINEQKAVVKILQDRNSKVDAISIELSHQLDLVKKLRQRLLQEAVQGKLVPQNPNDEPASELLKKIKAEKQKLISEGKLKKEKEFPPIKAEEIPFEIPESWVWCRLGNLCIELLGGFAFDSTRYSKTETSNQIIRLGNVKPNQLVLGTTPVYIDEVYANEAIRAKLFVGDILITMTGTRAKKDYLFTLCIEQSDLETKTLFLNQRVGCFRFGSFIFNKYINVILKDFRLLQAIFDSSTGAANQANIGMTALKDILIPLPPLSEQHRIVQKLDELMQVCDALEASIQESAAQNEKLLQQVLREALRGDAETTKNEVKINEFIPSNVDYYKRSVLAAEIVWQLHKEPTLGHLKLQKLIYLCQKTAEMQLPTNFLRQAMGPYDPRLMRSIDKQLNLKKWFTFKQGEMLKYKPLEKAGAHQNDYIKYFSAEKDNIQFIIDTFKNIKSNVVEIVATLFACIENMQDEKIIFSEAMLIQRFYDWSEEKKKFTEKEIIRVYTRMKEKGIIPKGYNI